MSGLTVGIVRTGLANLASVRAALGRLGIPTSLVHDADDLRRVGPIVLPGVGAFGAAMTELDRRGLTRPLVSRLEEGAPLLAICLGMQLLLEGSEESPGVAGLAVLPGRARPLSGTMRVPQLGWNEVAWDGEQRSQWAWFANSYCLAECTAPGWQVARATHGGSFVAALRRGRQLACQFHPELSGPSGAALLRAWWLAC